MNLRRCQPSEARATSQWIALHHYLQACPPGFVQVIEFTEGRELIGAMLLGRPAAKEYDPNLILQLHRMFFVDEAPKNTESRALSMMRKHVRTWLPQIRLLLSYSDPSVGHEGTIYEADGWARFGKTDGAWGFGWSSRKGRREAPVSKKQRWVRTP